MPDQLEELRLQLVARYDVERAIGRGGMATVYLATDRRHGRRVALKVLRPEFAESLEAERFRREIAIAATLTHPNILPLHDSTVDGSAGPLLFVMPFVDGETLRARLAAGRIPVREAVSIAVDVARALDYAHRQGIVHRDIKPENILLLDGHGVVTDFGIAHAVSEAGGDRLTQTGVLLGTPAYMSPEQIDGVVDLDGRSDVFSLGAVLYEMLAGAAPFTAPTTGATLARIAFENPPPLRECRSDVPNGVAAAVAKALAKNPGQRFADAGAFAAALEAASSTVTTVLSGHWPRRPRTALIASVGVIAVAAGGLFARLQRAPANEGLPSLAVLPFASESADTADAYMGGGIAEELLTALADLPGIRVASRSSSFPLGPQPDIRAAARRLGVATVLEGSVRRDGNTIRVTARLVDAKRDAELWGASFDRPASAVFETQEAIARAIVDRLRVRLVREGEIVRRRTASPEAHELVLRAKRIAVSSRTVDHLEAVALLERAMALDSSYAEVYAALATVYGAMAVFRDQARLPGEAGMSASEMLRRAQLSAERAVRLDSLSATAHAAYGNILFRYDWDWRAAERELRQAIALNPSAAEPYFAYTRFLRSMARFHEAREALDSADTRAGNEGQAFGHGGIAYGRISYYAAEYSRALRETLSDRQLDTARTGPAWLAQIYIGMHRYAAAESVAMLPRARLTPGWRATAAYIYASTGRGDSARALLARRMPNDDLPTLNAGVYIVLGDTASAIAELQRAIDTHDPLVVDISVDPWLKPLRQTPEFRRLVQRLAFPQAQSIGAAGSLEENPSR